MTDVTKLEDYPQDTSVGTIEQTEVVETNVEKIAEQTIEANIEPPVVEMEDIEFSIPSDTGYCPDCGKDFVDHTGFLNHLGHDNMCPAKQTQMKKRPHPNYVQKIRRNREKRNYRR